LSVFTTVLVFVGIPLAFILVVFALVLGGSSAGRSSRRYRPGRPYDFAPMWFLAAPDRLLTGRSAQTAQAPAIESGIIEDSSGNPVLPGPTGGASDRW